MLEILGFSSFPPCCHTCVTGILWLYMTFHILYRQQLLHSASSNLGGAPLYISAAYFVTSWKIFQTYICVSCCENLLNIKSLKFISKWLLVTDMGSFTSLIARNIDRLSNTSRPFILSFHFFINRGRMIREMFLLDFFASPDINKNISSCWYTIWLLSCIPFCVALVFCLDPDFINKISRVSCREIHTFL